MTTLCFIHQDKLALFVFCQKDGIIISCLLNPPGSSTEALVKMTSTFLAQVSKSGIPGWGKSRQWLVGFWKIDNVRNTTSLCVKWENLTVLKGSRALSSASFTYMSPFLEDPQKSSGFHSRMSSKKNYWEVDFRLPWYFPMTLALESYFGNGGEKILECDWRVLLFSTENSCGLLSAFPVPAGMKTQPNTFAKWHLSDL